jgi:hypothetical protein
MTKLTRDERLELAIEAFARLQRPTTEIEAVYDEAESYICYIKSNVGKSRKEIADYKAQCLSSEGNQ